jgi:hypothetical protein
MDQEDLKCEKAKSLLLAASSISKKQGPQEHLYKNIIALLASSQSEAAMFYIGIAYKALGNQDAACISFSKAIWKFEQAKKSGKVFTQTETEMYANSLFNRHICFHGFAKNSFDKNIELDFLQKSKQDAIDARNLYISSVDKAECTHLLQTIEASIVKNSVAAIPSTTPTPSSDWKSIEARLKAKEEELKAREKELKEKEAEFVLARESILKTQHQMAVDAKKWNEAERLASQLLGLAKKASYYGLRANAKEAQNNLDGALEDLKLAFAHHESSNETRVAFCFTMASIYDRKKDYDSALYQQTTALAFCEKAGNQDLRQTALYLRALLYCKAKKMEFALQDILKVGTEKTDYVELRVQILQQMLSEAQSITFPKKPQDLKSDPMIVDSSTAPATASSKKRSRSPVSVAAASDLPSDKRSKPSSGGGSGGGGGGNQSQQVIPMEIEGPSVPGHDEFKVSGSIKPHAPASASAASASAASAAAPVPATSPANNSTNNKLVHWSAVQVGDWLTTLGENYLVYKKIAQDGKLTGAVLCSADNEKALKTAGITNSLHRRVILHKVLNFV